jgi:hypothetical protein
MTQLGATETIAELDYRESNGITISLQWSRRSNRLRVVVEDSQQGESFTLPARPDNALEVFHHPYAYAQSLPRSLTQLSPTP